MATESYTTTWDVTAQEALCSLVVSGGDAAGVLQLVEAPFGQIAQAVE